MNLGGVSVNPANPTYMSVEGVVFNKNGETLILFPGGKVGRYTIPDNVAKIGSYAFGACSSLTDVTIGAGVINIEQNVFRDCTSLTDVIIPGNVITIEWGAFQNCASLTTVVIPTSVKTIDAIAFGRCGRLSKLYFEGDAPNPQERAGSVSSHSLATIVYYRPEARGWKETFAGRPTAIWKTPPIYADWIGTTNLPLGSTETDDPDQDDMDNNTEMLAGTDPTDAASVLILERGPRLTDLIDEDKTPINSTQHAVYVRSIPGKTYTVQWANSPTGPWNVDKVITASATQMRFVFDKPAGQAYYRVILAQ